MTVNEPKKKTTEIYRLQGRCIATQYETTIGKDKAVGERKTTLSK